MSSSPASPSSQRPPAVPTPTPHGILPSLRAYVGGIARTMHTVFEGLAVTSSWMFRRPMTIQYPDRLEKPVQEMLPEGYRGLLEVDLDRCTGCQLCSKACPIGCLTLSIEKNAETGLREVRVFDIDMGRCMYCGLCSEACKFDALSHTTDFEGSVDSPERLILHFVTAPKPVAKVKAGEGPPRRPHGSILAEVVAPLLQRQRWRGKVRAQ